MTAEHVNRWSTAGAVLGVAAVAAVASYEHAYNLVRAHGEAGWTARMVPPVPALAWWLLGLGIAATLAANVAHGLGHGLMGAAVAAWPAVALVGSYELLMMIIRSSQVTADAMPETERDEDPLQEQAAEVFAEQLATDRVPSIRAIRTQLDVGQSRAQRLREYLAAEAEKDGENSRLSERPA